MHTALLHVDAERDMRSRRVRPKSATKNAARSQVKTKATPAVLATGAMAG